MLAFFKSANPASKHPRTVAGEKQDDVPPPTTDFPVESTAVQHGPAYGASDPSTQPTDEPLPRVSSVSIPTIDSVPTIQGPPADSLSSGQTPVQPPSIPLPDSPNPAASLVPPSPANAQGSTSSVHTNSSIQSDRPMQSQSQSALPYSPQGAGPAGKDLRRFSFPSFAFLRSDAKQNKARTVSKATKNSRTGRGLSILIPGTAAASEKRAKESAVIVRSIIVGNHDTPPNSKASKTKPASRFDVARVKSQLLDPKTAPKVIAQLRVLPAHPDDPAANINVPIHAVCLDMPDRDVHEQHFAQLQSVASASVLAISTALAGVRIVDLLTAPNMGLGAPVTAQGLFAGSVPTAETVIDGIQQITPQLMALGYATGKAMLPDHKGVIVPTDRISVLTYWWGLEICIPTATITLLEAAESPGSSFLNLLTAISVLSEGVREILPFIRYIAQFVQTEWSMIKRANEGRGVVCTATWLLPVALVPRAWDFLDPLPPHAEMEATGQSTPRSPSVKRFSATLTTPKPSTEVANGVPRSSSAYSTDTRDEGETRGVISSEPPVLPELVVSSPGSIDGAPPENVDGEAHNTHVKIQYSGVAIAH